MNNYTVTWTFEVEANSPEEAQQAVRDAAEDSDPDFIRGNILFVYNQRSTVKLTEENHDA